MSAGAAALRWGPARDHRWCGRPARGLGGGVAEAIILAVREIGSLALLVGVVMWIVYRLRREDRRLG